MPPSALGCTSPLLKLKHENHFESSNGRIKCVLVGDGAVGKTSLVVSYSTNGFPSEYIPTAFDNYNVLVSVDGQPISVQLCDTAGQDDFDPLRPLCYPDTDVFLVCFSVVCPTSFENVSEKWVPELRRNCPDASLLLIGTQCDRRREVRLLRQLARYGQQPVSEMQAKELAKRIGAATYVETSALTQRDLKEAFDQAIVVSLAVRNKKKSKRNKNKNKNKMDKMKTDKKGQKHSFWRRLCCAS